MKKIITLFVVILTFTVSHSQTLFTYGNDAVAAPEFLRAYNKNNSAAGKNRETAVKTYLDLYINSKLKIREAYSRQMDTSAHFREELNSLRNQVIENYLTDPDAFDKLMREAFERSRKDIHVAHIFIAQKPGTGEDIPVKVTEISKLLQKGQDFASVARDYSEDPAAKSTGGDLGYITAFSLPYEFENIIYKTAPGKTAPVYHSAIGYHFFKNLGERKAVGRIKTAQILLAFPPGASDAQKKIVGELADSIYKRLKQGGDFAALAQQFSNDYVTAASGGQMTEFGLGTYDPAFENAAFSLKKDGDISTPLLTSHGYHIIRRVSKTEIPASLESDRNFADGLKYRVQNDDRVEQTKDLLVEKVKKSAGFAEQKYDATDLRLYTDSLLDGRASGKSLQLTNETPLFILAKKPVIVNDWIGYAQVNRYKRDGSGLKSYPELMEEFKKQQVLQYYRDHLENFNEAFRIQMNEFKDGNLFFEIMMQEIWTRAQTDSAGQAAFYTQHKAKYNWKESAGGVIFYCSDLKTAEDLRKEISADVNNWEAIISKYGARVTAEAGRFDYSQIPRGKGEPVGANKITGIEKNAADETASFAYIKKLFVANEPKSFEEARGAVINDYQEALDAAWIEALKKKYPVRINQDVLKSISK